MQIKHYLIKMFFYGFVAISRELLIYILFFANDRNRRIPKKKKFIVLFTCTFIISNK